MLSAGYPLWGYALCLLLGIAYALALYFSFRLKSSTSETSDAKFSRGLSGGLPLQENRYRRAILWGMGILRTLAVALIALLLLNPTLTFRQTRTEPPIVVVMVDRSQSIPQGYDSTFLRQRFPELMQQLVSKLGKFEVRTFAFGEALSDSVNLSGYTYRGKATNMSSALEEVADRLAGKNVGAVVLASDGLYNRGSNPVYTAQRLRAPLYTIALGDTTPKRDLRFNALRANEIAYLGNTFPIEAEIEALRLQGQSANMSVSLVGEGGRETTIAQRSVSISGQRFNATLNVTAEAKSVGIQHYRVRLAGLSGEATLLNNVRDLFVEVLQSKVRVLVYADAPHPDLGALRQALEARQNTEFTLAFADGAAPNLNAADVLILHQLPSTSHAIPQVLQKAAQMGLPTWAIAGRLTNFNALSQAGIGGSILAKGPFNEAQAVVNPSFSLFQLSADAQMRLPLLAPLNVPLGDTKAAGPVLLTQKIGSVTTNLPLLSFGSAATSVQRRTAMLFGEGLWRWRFDEFARYQSHTATNELIAKTVQYLTVRQDRRPFRARPERRILEEGESVLFSAELYDETFTPNTTAEVTLTLTNDQGKQFRNTFTPKGTGYTLNAGALPPGRYRYEARTSLNGKPYADRGTFAIRALDLERQGLPADHRLMAELASTTGGIMVYPPQIPSLADSLQARDTMKPIEFSEESVADLISLWWLMALILGLLSAEWVWRKYVGGY